MDFVKKCLSGLFICIVLVFVWSTWINIAWASDDATPCSWCHQNQAHNWVGSGHQQFGCSSCHVELDWMGMIGKQIMGMRDQIPVQVGEEVCLGCHSIRRKETPPGELIVPHELHNLKTVDCLDCHQNPGHTPRKTSTNATVSMNKCYECHNGHMASNNCQACHKTINKDPGHAVDNWLSDHGKQALTKFTCQQCHNYTTEELVYQRQLSSNFAKARRLSTNAQLCRECHQKRPVTHDQSFLWKHGSQGKDTRGCFVCHRNPQEADNISSVAKTNCKQCHKSDQHSVNWLSEHKLTVKDKGSSVCYKCHAPNNCGYCHLEER